MYLQALRGWLIRIFWSLSRSFLLAKTQECNSTIASALVQFSERNRWYLRPRHRLNLIDKQIVNTGLDEVGDSEFDRGCHTKAPIIDTALFQLRSATLTKNGPAFSH